jgi:sulfatase modifying factor 1
LRAPNKEVYRVNNGQLNHKRYVYFILTLCFWLSSCGIQLGDHLQIRSLEDIDPLIQEESWSRAVEGLLELYGSTPDRTVTGTLLSVVDEIERNPTYVLAPTTEIALIRWISINCDFETLAGFLDTRKATIPAGEFIMGSSEGAKDELPVHGVFLDSFSIDRFEVTNAQYQRFINETGEAAPRYWFNRVFPVGQGDIPVVGISWRQANACCAWMGGRLPTEAEWERACRGDREFVYPWGTLWDETLSNSGVMHSHLWPRRHDDAWDILASELLSESSTGLAPIGSYLSGASPFGLFDMVGNASEWVFDFYNWDGYWELPSYNPVSLEPPWNHSIRGSAWFYLHGFASEVPFLSRCSTRNSSHSYDDPRVGFRCAYDLKHE